MAGRGQTKRKDKDRIVLKKGEGERKNGTYEYRWSEKGVRRHVYAKTLDELREKEREIEKDRLDGISANARYKTVNEIYDLWVEVKRGLKDNTFQNYKYMYNTFVRDTFGKKRITTVKKTDVRKFYNSLVDERNLKASTVDGVHTVLHQIFTLAVEDDLIRNNPADNVLRELKKSNAFRTEKRRALTKPEQELFLTYLKENHQYHHWYPLMAVLVGTGMRIGEATGLRWCDIDLEEGMIDVNHTLIYYNRGGEDKPDCGFSINTTKTVAGKRKIPMLEFVKQAFIEEKEYQELIGLECKARIEGYTDFIFINRFGNVQNHSTINQAIKRIIRDCNSAVLEKDENAKVLLPNFSCHSLRHTFATRMCESGVNIKVIQDSLGHTDISTTMNIYADVTAEMKKEEFANLEASF